MELAHGILLALAYVSRILDPDSVRARFIESLNEIDGAYGFEYSEHLPQGTPGDRVFSIATPRSSFGHAVMAECSRADEAERSVLRNAFQLLAILLENRQHEQALQSKYRSLQKEISQETSMIRTVLNTLPVGVWVTDADGVILMGNAAGAEIWGGIRYVGPEQCGEYKAWWGDTGKPVAPEEWPIPRALATGETIADEEVNIESFDGLRKTIVVSAAPIVDDEGRVVGAVGVNQEITERKAAEKTLRLTEFSINRVNDMMSWISPEGRFLFVSDSICRNLGYTREELLDLPVWEVDPNTLDSWDERWLGSKKPGSPTLESIHRKKNGEVFPVEVTANHIEYEGQEYLVAFSRDISQRKRAEELLRDEVSRRRLLVEQSRDGIVVLDQNGKVYEANEAYARMLGYSMEEVSQLHMWDWDTQFGKEELLGMIEAIDENGDHFTTTHRRKDGTLCEVEISTNGTVYGGEKLVFCVCRDITESKRAAEAVRESEDRYQTLVNLSPDAILVNSGGKYVFTNPAAARLFGADSPRELVGQDMFERIHPDYRRLIAQADAGVQAGSVTPPLEIKVLRLDGSPVDVEVSATRIEFDGRSATHVVLHDSTERKRAEESLRLIELSVNRAIDQIFWGTEDGKIAFVNDAMCEQLGYTREELLQMDLWGFDPSPPSKWHEAWEKIKRERSLTLETVHITKDGREIPMYLSANYIEYNGKEYNCTVARDITERKLAEEERLVLERQLQHSQKLESLGVLAGGIAHDFNNILTSVLGNAELALSELSPSAPARENLLEITASSRRAAALCRQMLAYSGRGHFVTEAIDLGALVEDMLGLLKATISKKALLNLNLGKDLPPLRGDASQISQVVMNLVLNASEAIGERSGVINISTGAKKCSSKYLAQTYANENLAPGLYLSLEVSDTGAGMDKATQERIFEPFFTTKFTGRGLGLAAVLGIVRGHKGALRLESAVGEGTTFEILFPAAEADAALLARETRAANSSWKGTGTILLADDEETIRTLAARMLASLGFKVITAADGREALERYAEHQDEITLVILDLTMPHMDGAEAFRELRLLDPTVRVVMSSGYAENDIAARFAGQGLVGFVHKPYSLAELTDQIRAAFN